MQPESELSILLIEDEPDAAQLIGSVLSRGGNESVTVELATDLRTGLIRLEQKHFQAVLLDLNLPDSSGFDTFARVRQRAVEPAVIVPVSYTHLDYAVRGLLDQLGDYLERVQLVS